MNGEVSVMADVPVRGGVVEVAGVPLPRLFGWQVRREVWEHKWLYLAPVAVAVLLLLGFCFGPGGMQGATIQDQSGARYFMATQFCDFASMLIEGTALLVGAFYLADALYAERRDKSILFWKSLPVPDWMAVLAKAAVPVVVLPVIAFVTCVVTQLVIAVVSSLAMMHIEGPAGGVWAQLSFGHAWVWLLWQVLVVTSLWYAPFYGWFLFVSSWANKAPMLLAVLPPLAVCLVEKIYFHTNYVSEALGERVKHGNVFSALVANHHYLPPGMRGLTFDGMGSVEFWAGLVVAGGLFAAAVRMRRYKGVI